MNRIYISGPISGTDDYMERFAKAEQYLKKEGYIVFNPARVSAQLPQDNITWTEYMKIGLTMLEMCDAIYMLKDWQKSCGACMEHGYAYGKDMNIIFEYHV